MTEQRVPIPIKYPKIKNTYSFEPEDLPTELYTDTVQIKEKLDGSNFRFMLRDGELVFGTRNVSPITEDRELFGGENFESSFVPYIEYIKKTVDRDKMCPYCIYFGEAMIRHKIPYENPEMFYGFDIYCTKESKFLSNWKQLYEGVGLSTVKVYDADDLGGHRDFSSMSEYVKSGKMKSFIDGKSPIEGVIVADYGRQTILKRKTVDFEEVQRTVKIRKESPHEGFFKKYFVKYRLLKILDKMETGELKYGKKNPFAGFVQHVLMDVFEEATTRDLVKSFGQLFRHDLIDKIRADDELMRIITSMSNLK